MLLEACVNSACSAIEAEKGGADRVELCANMLEGGCTPGPGSIEFAREHIRIGLFIMIRPRGADFCYTDDEFAIMKKDVVTAKKMGADGVVFGILKPNGTIDKERMARLAELARPLEITCHRAFDMTRDPFEAMEDLISLGIDRILTSGQSDHALTGARVIRDLISRSKDKIIIMPGHGVKEYNLEEVIRATGANEYHLYLTRKVTTKMKYIRNNMKMGPSGLSEYDTVIVDRERLAEAKRILTDYSGSLPKIP